jgi:hypothetical protein
MALEIVATKYAYAFDPKDLVHLQMTNRSLYVTLYPHVERLYSLFVKSDKYRGNVIRELNELAYMINQFKWVNKILNNKMYEYLILCYENWSWITLDNYKQLLIVPNSKHFSRFMQDRGIRMNELLPNVEFHYTHHHRPTKSFTYYKTIKPHKPHL